MRLKLLVSVSTIIVALGAYYYGRNSGEHERLAVVSRFGQLRGFLLSTNYTGAYNMMSSGYKTTNPFNVFKAGDEHGAVRHIFLDDIPITNAIVEVYGTNAELRI